MSKLILLALAAWTAAAQTQIDLRSQAKRVDFTEAGYTKPLKTGTALPAHCSIGEMFFKSDAPAGANVYGCAATDTWTAQGGLVSENCWDDPNDKTLKCRDAGGNIHAAVQTTTQGAPNQWVDYITPAGMPHTSQPTAAAVGAVADPGANGIPYRSAAGAAAPANADHLSRPLTCEDTGNANAYACDLLPAISGYTAGTSYWFKSNSTNTGSATLNLNRLGARPIVKQSNKTLAAGDIQAGQWVMVTFDGIAMQMQSQTANAASGAIATVFGRTGAVAPQAGDYTTAQVTESGNLYFTNPRAQQAFSYPGTVKLSAGALDCPTCVTTATAADTDLSGSFPHLNVVRLQGRSVAATQPADQQYLAWNSSASRWEPKTLSAAPVASIFGRTGAIAQQTGDYSFPQIAGSVSTGQLPPSAMRTDRSNSIAAGTTQDFSAADHTLPMKSGPAASLPAACQPGEAYFATDAAAGNNVYGCTAANAWTVQGAAMSVKSDGIPVGSRATTNYVTGPGLMSVISDSGSEIEVLSALDTAAVQTQFGEQSGTALYCVSGSASATDFQCSLIPSAAEYAPGMVLHWQPDVSGAGGPTTINVDGLGAKPLKLPDGAGDPGPADIIAGRLYEVWYDGATFRFLQTAATVASGLADPGGNGVVYRNGAGATARATANEMSGPSYCLATGAGGTYACDLNPALTGYTAGTTYWFQASGANSGPATINFNLLGSKAIKKRFDQELEADDIVAGQLVTLTYDGTAMQMMSPTASAAGAVGSVFGRTGAVTASAGDYTTAQVTESGNLYFTDDRARAAVTWGALSGKPAAFAPAGHAASHQNGGGDEIATAAPAANAIPKAGASGRLAAGWLPLPGGSSIGGVQAGDCSSVGFVQKINADGSVSCASGGQGGQASARTWTYFWQGAAQAGATGFAVNLPAAGAPVFANSGGTRPIATLEWPAGQSAYYSWWTFILPAGYPSNGPISYALETRSADSTNYANVYLGVACGGAAVVDNPAIVETAAIQIQAAASNGRTVRTGSITPGSGGLPACAAGDRVWINLRVDANVAGHVMTQPFDLISALFSVQGGL